MEYWVVRRPGQLPEIGFVSHDRPFRGPAGRLAGAELGLFGAIAPMRGVGLAPPISLGGWKLGLFRTIASGQLALFVPLPTTYRLLALFRAVRHGVTSHYCDNGHKNKRGHSAEKNAESEEKARAEMSRISCQL